MKYITLVSNKNYNLHEYYANTVMQTAIVYINELITCSQALCMAVLIFRVTDMEYECIKGNKNSHSGNFLSSIIGK